jgi:hypothetical protein
MAVRHFRVQPLTAPTPASERRHVGLRPRLVDEDEAFGIEDRLQAAPANAAARDVRPILFTGERAFF